MSRNLVGTLVLVSLVSVSLVRAQQRASPQPPQHPMTPMSDEAAIKSAMTAAPAAIAKDATIVTMSPDMKMTVIRKGSNNFTCMPDNPQTPGPDPMCGDQNAMAWVEAWVNKREPAKDKVGFMYMLAGGTDASNTDPYAQKPTPGNNWVSTGPHVMIVGGKGMLDAYPRSPKPDTTKPYVMFPGTPYEHLMIPIK